MSTFILVNSAISKTGDLITILSGLPINERTAVLGLVIGLTPKINIILKDADEASKVWNTSYYHGVNKSLENLSKKVLINKLAIAKAAKDVFIRRATTRPFSFLFHLQMSVAFNEDIDENERKFIIDICQHIESKCGVKCISSLEDFINKNREMFSVVNEAINKYSIPGKTGINTSNHYRNLIEQYYTSVYGLYIGRYCYINKDVLANLISSSFIEDVLPGYKGNGYWDNCFEKDSKYFKSIQKITSLVKSLRYDLTDDRKYKVDIKDTRGLLSMESFEPVVFDNYIESNISINNPYLEDENIIDNHITSLHLHLNRMTAAKNILADLIDEKPLDRNRIKANSDQLKGFIDLSNIQNAEISTESFSEAMGAILEFLARHMNKIIPIIMAIIVGVVGLMIKRRLADEAEKSMDDIVVTYRAETEKLNENPLPPIESVIDTSKTKAKKVEIESIFKTRMDEYILNKVPGYTWDTICKTMEAHLSITKDMMKSLHNEMGLINSLLCLQGSDPHPFTEAVKKIKEKFEENDYYKFSYCKKHFFELVKSAGGSVPDSSMTNGKLDLVTKDVYIKCNSDMFWNGSFKYIDSDRTAGRINNKHIYSECKNVIISGGINQIIEHIGNMTAFNSAPVDELKNKIDAVNSEAEGVKRASDLLANGHKEFNDTDKQAGRIFCWPEDNAGKPTGILGNVMLTPHAIGHSIVSGNLKHQLQFP